MTPSLPKLLLAIAVLPLAGIASTTLRLEDIPAERVEQGYGEARANKTVDGAPIVIAGVNYERGLGTHAPGRIQITLDGGKAMFTAKAGLPDSVKGTQARVEFIVRGDGKTLWKSGRVLPGNPAKDVSVDLTGIKKLELVVTDGGNGNTSDHAVWADAKIVAEGAAPEVGGVFIHAMLGASKLSIGLKDDVPQITLTSPSGKKVLSGNAYPGLTDAGTSKPAISVVHGDGSNALNLVYASHTVSTTAPGVTEIALTLKDKARPFEVTLHYVAHADSGVLEQWSVLRNGADKSVVVREAASGYLPLAGGVGETVTFYNSVWGDEMKPVKRETASGTTSIDSVSICRHIAGSAPCFTLALDGKPVAEESGSCLLGALAWSGAHRFALERPTYAGAQFTAGVRTDDAHYTIDPGKTLETPKLITTVSDTGLSAASRNLHKWARESTGLREANRTRYIDNNSWEGAYFDVGTARVAAMIEGSAKLGVELYLLDDGWFATGENARNGDKSGLGDWELNTAKIPSMDALIDVAEKNGMKFGLWVEPEMINEKSNLFKAHPEWVLRYPDREPRRQRNQLVLDLSNPAVQDFVFKTVDDVLTKWPRIAYIKWDANSDTTAPHSTFLAADRQGDLPWRYMQGYYAVMKRLVEKHPGTLFQACSSGGGRGDYGALKYSQTMWPSDNTSPGYRLKAAWSYSTFYPVAALTSHVTHTGSGYTPKYRMDISFFGQFGCEFDPAHLKPDYRDAVTTAIADYKKVRDVIQQGEQYRTLSPFDGSVAAVDYVSADKNHAVLLGYHSGEKKDVTVSLPLRGLDAAKTYKLREMNLPAGERARLAAPAGAVSGAELLKSGLPVSFKGDNDSVSVELTAQ